MKRMAVLTVLAAGLAGCGGGPAGGTDMGGRADMGPTMETCATDNLPVALVKTYGVKGTLNVNVKVTSDCTGDGCIFDGDAKASILLLADVTQNGQTATVTARPCAIRVPPVALKGQPMPTVLTAPDALVQSVKPVTASASLKGPNTCAGFTSDPIAIVLGARLANAASDPLPMLTKAMPPVKFCGGVRETTCDQAMDTACVCDQEGDKKAAATVNASGTPVLDDIDQVYLALRTVVVLDGAVFPSGMGQAKAGQRIKGAIAGLKLDQSPVGCHRMPTGGAQPGDCSDADANALAGFNPLVTQSANAKSTFVGMPVDDGTTCAQLIADEATLFRNQ